MFHLRMLLLLGLMLMLPACTGRLNLVGRSIGSPGWSEWSATQGGVMDDALRCGRANNAVLRLTDGKLAVSMHVLDSPSVTAYSYADGNIFVTRGLVDVATNDELSAAVAHELGHLLSDGHLPAGPYASAVKQTAGMEKESRADAVGATVLGAHGISRSVMVRMLTKVARRTPSVETRAALAGRIESLGG